MSAIRHRRHRSAPRATSRRPPWGPAAALPPALLALTAPGAAAGSALQLHATRLAAQAISPSPIPATGAAAMGGSSWTTTPGAGPLSVPVTLEGTTALSFRATDLAGNVESAQTATIRIDTVRTQATGVDLGYMYRCTLAKGKYTWRVYARDLAGNTQTSIGATTLTVR